MKVVSLTDLFSTVFNYSMKSLQRINFDHIESLNLLDLKAQKKNINYKKFFDIPLSFEEKIANRIQEERIHITHNLSKSQNLFSIKKKGKMHQKSIEKLSNPKRNQENLNKTESCGQLQGIIKKCDRLKSVLLTNKKLFRF